MHSSKYLPNPTGPLLVRPYPSSVSSTLAITINVISPALKAWVLRPFAALLISCGLCTINMVLCKETFLQLTKHSKGFHKHRES
jgi:hypothetical protein